MIKTFYGTLDPRRGIVDERRVDGVGREEVVAEPVDEVVALF